MVVGVIVGVIVGAIVRAIDLWKVLEQQEAEYRPIMVAGEHRISVEESNIPDARNEQVTSSVEDDGQQHGLGASSFSPEDESSTNVLDGVSRETYIDFYVPMYKAALKGEWWKAKELIAKKPELRTARLTIHGETALHLAAGAKHFTFVKEIVTPLRAGDLEIRDKKNNTPLVFAAAAGSKHIVQLLVNKNENLPLMRGGGDMTPLYMAVVSGDRDTICFLSRRSGSILTAQDLRFIFFTHLNNDLALEMLNDNRNLALARDGDGETALHFLARKPRAFAGRNKRIWRSLLINSSIAQNGRWVQTEVVELAKKLWELVLQEDHEEVMKLISDPPLLFSAVEHGNYELVSMLISSYPQLIWETNEHNHTIIHVAVLNRQAQIFNLIHEIGALKEIIVAYIDDEGNNILHLAAKSAPENQLNVISGAALQMQRELLWFQEVKKHVPPAEREKRNNMSKTPKEMFTSEHRDLLKNGEKWIKTTAKYFMLVAALVATVVFTAPFSFYSNNVDFETIRGSPFIIFSTSDSIALFTAATSILVFLFILTSRYSEKDFLTSLPCNLISGLISLFLSIAAMIVSFSSTFFISYDHGVRIIPIMVSLFALLPIVAFAIQQIPLLHLLCKSTYHSRFIFRPGKSMLR